MVQGRVRSPAWCMAVVFLVGNVVMPVQASTFIRSSLEDLVTTNQTVVVAQVLETNSHWNDDGTFILTDVLLAPIEVLKGSSLPKELNITLMGGTVGDLTTVIVGGAVLVAGRSYVLFLDRLNLPGAEGALTVRDHCQGAFDILATGEGLRAVSQARMPLLPDSRGLSEVPGGSHGFRLDTMLESIRALIAEKEAKR